MMDKSAIFGALRAAWGAPTWMGPPQRFLLAVSDKITQIFSQNPESSGECQLNRLELRRGVQRRASAICRHCEAVFDERQSPADQHYLLK
jgi:hypothetical protein